MKKKKERFDKYLYYKQSVQSPEEDIKFFSKVYRSVYKKNPRLFREDFCGTFLIGCHWVKAHRENKAIVVDKSREPLDYGRKHHFARMSLREQARLRVVNKNISSPSLPKAEIISVSNFSYFALRERKTLFRYFKNVRRQLMEEGLFIIDAFGGAACEEANEESVSHGGFNYYWDQENFNPITNHSRFHIHFKRRGEQKRERVFSYDWRMWSLPELRDVLADAGFSKTHVYLEFDSKKKGEAGIFKKARLAEPHDTWLAYLVSLK